MLLKMEFTTPSLQALMGRQRCWCFYRLYRCQLITNYTKSLLSTVLFWSFLMKVFPKFPEPLSALTGPGDVGAYFPQVRVFLHSRPKLEAERGLACTSQFPYPARGIQKVSWDRLLVKLSFSRVEELCILTNTSVESKLHLSWSKSRIMVPKMLILQ